MPEERLRLIVEGDEKGAISTLRQVNKGLDETGETSKRTGRQIDGLKRRLEQLAVGFVTVETARRGIQLAELSMQAGRTEDAFEALSGGQTRAAANMEALQRASDGLLSRMESQQQANRLLSLNIVQTSDELERFTRGAIMLGAAMNMDATESVENLSSAIANMSFVRLDQMGLSAAATRERVEELTEGTQGLSKEAAFAQAVMEQMEEKTRALEEAGFEAATEMDRLRAVAADLQVTIGDQLAPELEGTANVLFRIATILNENPNLVRFLLGGGGAQIPFTSPFTAGLDVALRAIERGQEFGAFDFIGEGADLATDALSRMAEGAVDAGRAHSRVLSPALETVSQHIEFTTGLELDLAGALEQTEQRHRGMRAGIDVHEQGLQNLAAATEQADRFQRSYAESFIRTEDAAGVLTVRLRRLRHDTVETEGGMRVLTDAQTEAAGASDALGRMMVQAAGAADQLASRAANAANVLTGFAQGVIAQLQGMDDAIESALGARARVDPAFGFKQATRELIAAQRDLARATATGDPTKIAAAYERLFDAQEGVTQATQRYNSVFNQVQGNVSSGLSDQEKALREIERVWDEALGNIRSVVEGALQPDLQVTEEDMLLAQLGLREDTAFESVRRLNDVIQRAMHPEEFDFEPSPWIDAFGELQGLVGDELAARAIMLRDDILGFMRPDQLNFEAVVREAEEALIAQANREQFIQRVMDELVARGHGESQVRQVLSQEFGTSADAAVDAFTRSLTQAGPELAQLTSETFVPAFQGAAGAIVEMAEEVDPELTGAIETFRTGELADVQSDFEAWLEVVEELVGNLEKLQGLTIPSDTAPPPQGPGFQSGGSFVVPSGFPNDTFPMRVSSGERVTVEPRGGVGGGGGVNVNFYGNVVIRDRSDIDALASEITGRAGLRNRNRRGSNL